MALKVQPKNRLRSQPQAEVEEETEETTETKAEPKITVNATLASLMKQWNTAWDKADSFFPKIVQHVIENGTSKPEIKKALQDYRGLVVPTLNNELSVIWRVKDHPDEVQACIDGDDNPDTGKPWTVTQLRAVGRKKQDAPADTDPEERVAKLMDKVADYAIEVAHIDSDEFVKQARRSFKNRAAAIEAKLAKEQAEGEESESEEEGVEEEEE